MATDKAKCTGSDLKWDDKHQYCTTNFGDVCVFKLHNPGTHKDVLFTMQRCNEDDPHCTTPNCGSNKCDKAIADVLKGTDYASSEFWHTSSNACNAYYTTSGKCYTKTNDDGFSPCDPKNVKLKDGFSVKIENGFSVTGKVQHDAPPCTKTFIEATLGYGEPFPEHKVN